MAVPSELDTAGASYPGRQAARIGRHLRKEKLMRTIMAATIALGCIGATTLGTPSTASAQGFYFYGPGVSFGVGSPWYRPRYYDPYAYAYYGRPYWRHRHYYRWRGDWD
jgi:hypothetical protein